MLLEVSKAVLSRTYRQELRQYFRKITSRDGRQGPPRSAVGSGFLGGKHRQCD
jgi:hypothetical protein